MRKALLLAALLVPAQAWAKIGLSSQFINVAIENLKPGRTYNLRELKGVPYTVKNRGDGAVDVIVEVLAPQKAAVREPYVPIPDPTWVRINPDRYRLNPGDAGFSDLVISIPDDPALLGKHFHAVVWAHTVGKGLLQAGVKSDIRFSIGKGPETEAEDKRRAAMVELNYDLWPASLSLSPESGKKWDAKAKEKKSFKLTNRAEKDLELVLKAIPWQTTLVPLPEGYETVNDLGWVKFSPETVKVEPDSVKEIKVTLDAPESLKGKKIAFLVQLSLPIGTIVGATHRVYVDIK